MITLAKTYSDFIPKVPHFPEDTLVIWTEGRGFYSAMNSWNNRNLFFPLKDSLRESKVEQNSKYFFVAQGARYWVVPDGNTFLLLRDKGQLYEVREFKKIVSFHPVWGESIDIPQLQPHSITLQECFKVMGSMKIKIR